MSYSIRPGLTDHLPAPELLQGPHGTLVTYPFPAPQPRLHVLVSHGFGEHSGWWAHVATALQQHGVSATLFDHYHHGRSAGAPADVPDYAHLVAGLRTVLERAVLPRLEGTPLVLLAHSNGALVALLALAELAPTTVQGVALSSPYVGMRPPMSWFGPPLAAVLRWIRPGFHVPLPTRPWRLTTLREIWPQYRADPLRFRSLTVRFFLAMRRALHAVQDVQSSGGRPLLLLSAGRERVVHAPAMRRWFARVEAPWKVQRHYPRLRHELFNEGRWEEVLADLLAWCDAYVTTPADSGAPQTAALAREA